MASTTPRPQDIARLQEKTSCNPQDCARALSQGEGSLLSALLLLEAEGQVEAPAQGGSFSTKDQDAFAEFPDFAKPQEDLWTWPSFYQMLRQEVFDNHLCVWAGPRQLFRVPVLLIMILFPISYGTLLPLAVIPMFFGIEYRFSHHGSFLAEFNPILRRCRKALSIFGRNMRRNNKK